MLISTLSLFLNFNYIQRSQISQSYFVLNFNLIILQLISQNRMGNCQMMVDHCLNAENMSNKQTTNPSQSYYINPLYPQSWYGEPLDHNIYQIPYIARQIVEKNSDLAQQKQLMRGTYIEKHYFIRQLNLCYKGQWINGRPEGKGQITFEDGSFLKGYFDQGYCQGQDCLFVDRLGSFYRGSMEKSLFNGKGSYSNENYRYTGNWLNGFPHGEGIQEFLGSQGATYRGNFIQGIKSGVKCQYIWNNHVLYDRYQGSFDMDWLAGRGRLFKKNGDIVQGDFDNKTVKDATIINSQYQFKGQLVDGVIQGQGILKLIKQDKQYEGGFKSGQMHGRGIFKYPSGKIQQVYFIQGKQLRQCYNFDQDLAKGALQIIQRAILQTNYMEDACQYIQRQMRKKYQKSKQLQFSYIKDDKDIGNQIQKFKSLLAVPVGNSIITIGK